MPLTTEIIANISEVVLNGFVLDNLCVGGMKNGKKVQMSLFSLGL